jgi:Tfp pilus assembly protein PilX
MNNHRRFFSQATSILKDEKGMVIITAMMILVLLTIIGIASTTVSNTETKIATNEAVYQQNFYQAEGATMEAVEVMEGMANPKTAAPGWLWASLNTFTEDNLNDTTFWEGTMTGADAVPEPSAALADTTYVVVSGGIVEGESLDMGSTKIHRYAVFGRCAPPSRGATTVEIGYLKAF